VVCGWFRELARQFLFQTIHDVAVMLDRQIAGREASPARKDRGYERPATKLSAASDTSRSTQTGEY